MPTTYRGGCLCRAIRYEIAAEAMFAGQCQCLDCQHESGGGHTSFLAFPTDAVSLTGTPRFYEVKADSGNRMRRGFCPTCGSPVIGASSGLPGLTTISAGSLDDPGLFAPQFVCYTIRGHAWDLVDPALPSFTKMPPVTSDADRAARGTQDGPVRREPRDTRRSGRQPSTQFIQSNGRARDDDPTYQGR